MKKIIFIVLALSMLLPFAIAVFAVEAETANEKITLAEFLQIDGQDITAITLQKPEENEEKTTTDKEIIAHFINIANSTIMTSPEEKTSAQFVGGMYLEVSLPDNVSYAFIDPNGAVDAYMNAMSRFPMTLYIIDDEAKTDELLTEFWNKIGSTEISSTLTSAVPDNNVFDDVPSDYWASNEIQKFADNNIVHGIGDNIFAPEAGVTREQFCKIMVLSFNAPLDNDGEQIFSDVELDRWSFPYVNKCKDFLTGYINPFGGLPSFRPEEYATREDIAVALVRIMGITEIENEENYYIMPSDNFTDAEDVSPRLRRYVWLAHEYKLISGYPDGSFRPKNKVTRAETVVLLDRAITQAFADINGDLFLNISEYSNSMEYAEIDIVTDNFVNVTVDGVGVEMGAYGMCRYLVYYNGANEKTVTVTASSFGKSVTKQFTVKRNESKNDVKNDEDIEYDNNTPTEETQLTTVSIDLSYSKVSTSDTAVITGTVKEKPESGTCMKVCIGLDTYYLTNGVPLDEVFEEYGFPADKTFEGNNFRVTVNLVPGENIFEILAYSRTSDWVTEKIVITYTPN